MRVNRLESAERVDAAVGLRPDLAEGRIGIRTSLEVLKNACQFGTRRWCVSVSDVDPVRPMSVPAAQATGLHHVRAFRSCAPPCSDG